MRRWFERLLVVVLVGVAGVAFGPVPASAHGQFVRSDPAAGSTITESLTSLSIYFTEKPTSNAFFSVTAPGGARVDRLWSHGTPVALETEVKEYYFTNGRWETRSYDTAYPATVPVAYWPAVGEYTVKYLSVASDNQLVQGELTFTYSGAVTTAPADFRPQKSEPDPNLLAVSRSDQPTEPPVGDDGETATEAQAEDSGSAVLLWLVLPLLVAGIVVAIFFLRGMRGGVLPGRAASVLSPLERRLARQRVAQPAVRRPGPDISVDAEPTVRIRDAADPKP